jgi:hypothetical protein
LNGSKPNTGTEIIARSYPDWDVEPLLERVWNHLGGTVSRSTIRQVLAEVLPNYESAPIQTFVPIFIHNETVKRLQAGLGEVPPHHGAVVMPDTGEPIEYSGD